MIINPNLVDWKDFTKPPHPTNRNNYWWNDMPTDLEEGQTYTISADAEQTAGGSGIITIRTYDSNIETMYSEKHCEIVDGKVYASFVYDKTKSAKLLLYTDEAMYTEGIGATFKKIKLEKGDTMTTYIPNANSLSADKQAILTKGGGIYRGLSNLVNILQTRGLAYVS